MSNILPQVSRESLPGLYQSAGTTSATAQRGFSWGLGAYLIFLILGVLASYFSSGSPIGAIISAALFLLTLGILIGLRTMKPIDTWYNGRAVAESVKTRAWRWMMRADPYQDSPSIDSVTRQFIADLKVILGQNRSLGEKLASDAPLMTPVTEMMKSVRALPVSERLAVYLRDRVEDQASWYGRRTRENRSRSRMLFWASVVLHGIAIIMLLIQIWKPSFRLPVEVIATAASSVLTWLQAKKHNEQSASYALAAHEISLVRGEAVGISSETDLSDYVVNAETAFSREHTQWAARKNE